VYFAPLYPQIHAVQGLYAGKRFGDVPHFENAVSSAIHAPFLTGRNYKPDLGGWYFT
jgi:hypothetical protein